MFESRRCIVVRLPELLRLGALALGLSGISIVGDSSSASWALKWELLKTLCVVVINGKGTENGRGTMEWCCLDRYLR